MPKWWGVDKILLETLPNGDLRAAGTTWSTTFRTAEPLPYARLWAPTFFYFCDSDTGVGSPFQLERCWITVCFNDWCLASFLSNVMLTRYNPAVWRPAQVDAFEGYLDVQPQKNIVLLAQEFLHIAGADEVSTTLARSLAAALGAKKARAL